MFCHSFCFQDLLDYMVLNEHQYIYIYLKRRKKGDPSFAGCSHIMHVCVFMVPVCVVVFDPCDW